ncbi:helix-turn-helix domain-containing protein [Succinivibrio sp.]|uniref:helix-turn-helix domain-containing protein n=1 Tax=Succinivibrio sp. TaxID=2053619 RepID=UPI0025CC91BE|nr:helix-turn-helix domain-containing protein [Succinivibrio sp.]MBQ9222090.1 hypothetical protein [Succinivibrio sp.]
MQKIEFYLFTGDEICKLREKMGLSKDSFKHLLNITEFRLKQLETGKKELTPEQSKLLVDALKKQFKYDASYSVESFLKIQLKM